MKILKRLEDISFALLPSTHPDTLRCRHFAFLLRKNRIVAIGWNKVKTHSVNRKYNYHPQCHLHAEMDAVLKSKRDNFSGYILAVLRIDKNNKLNQSAPCRWCSGALDTLGINNIYHTTEDGSWKRKITSVQL